MAPQDRDGLVDPALVAAWQRMLWLVRGSADVVEALAPIAAGMTKDEISRLLARAGAPSGKGVEPVEQVLALLGVVPRSRYEALLKDYEELAGRVEEAEQNIEHVRRQLREQGLVDEAEQLVDSWGGLVRRTLRAQAGFVRSIANAGGTVRGPSVPPADAPVEPVAAEAPAPAPRREPVKPEPTRAEAAANGATKKPAAKKPAATKKPAARTTRSTATTTPAKRTPTPARTSRATGADPAKRTKRAG